LGAYSVSQVVAVC